MSTDDEFLSDVHLQHKPSECTGKQVWQTTFRFKKNYVQPRDGEVFASENVTTAAIDEDGDYVVARRQGSGSCFNEDVIIIEHSMATPVGDVGLQVWNGALLLCDFIVHNQDLFKNTTVLELGAGVGLSSIVMATIADKVFCTDVGMTVLETCRRNVESNEEIRQSHPVIVRELDWMQILPNTDEKNPFHWRKEDLLCLKHDVTVVIAADIVYDDELTDGFFRTLYNQMTTGQMKTAYIAIEKRLNFTVADLEVTCGAYDHFRDCVEFLESLDDKCDRHFTVTQISTDFPQYFQYSRIKQLELWKISCEVKGQDTS